MVLLREQTVKSGLEFRNIHLLTSSSMLYILSHLRRGSNNRGLFLGSSNNHMAQYMKIINWQRM